MLQVCNINLFIIAVEGRKNCSSSMHNKKNFSVQVYEKKVSTEIDILRGTGKLNKDTSEGK